MNPFTSQRTDVQSHKLEALHKFTLTNLRNVHLQPSRSRWNAPIVLTRKKNGKWRFAQDLRKLNHISVFSPYPLPLIEDLLALTRDAKIFSAIDLQSVYWNFLVHPRDREKLAFTVPGLGKQEWRSMPFGLHASGPHFQRSMECMLQGLSWSEVTTYVDDLLIFTKNMERHVLSQVFERLEQGGFTPISVTITISWVCHQ